MHTSRITTEQIATLDVRNWFRISVAELELLRDLHAQELAASRLRTGNEIVLPPNYVKGVPAPNIEPEMNLLAEQTSRILETGEYDSGLRAAAFFHLRFEGIHPLTDGNGRVGRLIMAAQCVVGMRGAISIEAFLEGIQDNRMIYKSVFLANVSDPQRYELLVDLLGRVLGMYERPPRFDLPFPIAPAETERVGSRFRFVPLPVSSEVRALLV